MNFIGIIPARYASTRLEGKPLAQINGKPMIQWVYEKASKALDSVYVATDDNRIKEAVEAFGGKVVLTDKNHLNGTTRCLEAAQIIQEEISIQADVIVNIQGDEPMLEPEQLKTLMNCFEDEQTEFATLITPVKRIEDLQNNSEVFVTKDLEDFALYFSRNVIPHIRGTQLSDYLQKTTIYKHLGLYAYTLEALNVFAELEPSNLEQLEGLEQLRWIENGGLIKCGITEHDSIPVDTPEDLERVRAMMK